MGTVTRVSTWATPERPEPPHDPVDEPAALTDRLEYQRTTFLHIRERIDGVTGE